MTREQYEKTNLAQMKLKRWRLNRDVVNGNLKVPSGHEVVIEFKRDSSLNISGKVCKCCGVAARVRKVPFTVLDEIADEPIF